MQSPDQFSPKSSEKFTFKVGTATAANEVHPGRNEDAFLSLASKHAFAVFDGVGGYNAGNIASATARDFIKEGLESFPDNLSLEDRKVKIEEIFKNANSFILKKAVGNLDKMASTVAFIQFCKDTDGMRKAIVSWAGDSRVYVLRSGRFLDQVTVDDNKIIPEVRAKLNNVTDMSSLNEAELASWAKRHKITNALGFSDFKSQISVIDLKHDDIVILTSDGIHDNLTNKEIVDIILGREDSSVKASRLVETAQKRSEDKTFRSKKDDMTAIVISQMS